MKLTKILIKKAKAIFANGMLPIICCGESLETYEAGKAAEFVGAQVSAALAGLTAEQVAASVIAYEPIWAIGTGKSASQDDAQKMCKVVRDVVAADFGQEVAIKYVFNTVVQLNLKTLQNTWLVQTLTELLLVVHHLIQKLLGIA